MDELKISQKGQAWDTTRDPSFDGVVIIRPDGTIQSANLQFYEILKVTPAEIIDRPWHDLVPYPSKIIVQQNVTLVAAGHERSYRDRVRLQMPQGHKVEVHAIFSAVHRTDRELDFLIKRVIEAAPMPLSSSESLVGKWHIWLKANLPLLAIFVGTTAWIVTEVGKAAEKAHTTAWRVLGSILRWLLP